MIIDEQNKPRHTSCSAPNLHITALFMMPGNNAWNYGRRWYDNTTLTMTELRLKCHEVYFFMNLTQIMYRTEKFIHIICNHMYFIVNYLNIHLVVVDPTPPTIMLR